MATIRDVAKLAGVGLGTVSRVLSGNGSVSSKTQLKVSQAMATLNFTPNNAARSLVSKKKQYYWYLGHPNIWRNE